MQIKLRGHDRVGGYTGEAGLGGAKPARVAPSGKASLQQMPYFAYRVLHN